MPAFRLCRTVPGLVLSGFLAAVAAADDKPPKSDARPSPDQKFEGLLAAAEKDPEKADWKALRLAFSDTSHYQPYNPEWRKDLARVGQTMEKGDLKAAEQALLTLLRRERLMRIDAQAMAVGLYQKMGE